MTCPQCHTENPESNFFCGKCGTPLKAAPPLADSATGRDLRPPDSSEQSTSSASVRRPFIVTTTSAPSVSTPIQNPRVVLPSRPAGTSGHSGYASSLFARADERTNPQQLSETEPAVVDPLDEPVFNQPEAREVLSDPLEDQIVEPVREPRSTPRSAYTPPREEPSRYGSILGLTTPLEELEVEDSQPPASLESTAPPEFEESVNHFEPVETEASPEANREVAERNPFFQFDEPAGDPSHDVSGPSFLGLGSQSQDYLLEDQEPVSHGRRYLLLFALLIVAGLGYLEWRASRNGDSTNPMDVLHLKLPQKKGQGEVVVVPPAANAPAENPAPPPVASTSGNDNNGKPDLIAEPNQPAQQKPTPPPASTAAANAPENPPPSAAADEQPKETASAKPEATSAPDTTSTPPAAAPAKPAPAATKAPAPAQVAKSVPADHLKPSASRSAGAVASRPSTARASAAAASDSPAPVDASLSAGSLELQKGIAAGQNEVGRMWLWKSLGLGNGEAPVLLAEMYAQGKGVPKDCEQAMLLLNAAAKKANPRARSKLGSMYATGECVPKDRVRAYQWMSAALQVNPGSEWIERNRDSLLKEMTPAERQRASR